MRRDPAVLIGPGSRNAAVLEPDVGNLRRAALVVKGNRREVDLINVKLESVSTPVRFSLRVPVSSTSRTVSR
jgi:hypothetical protein